VNKKSPGIKKPWDLPAITAVTLHSIIILAPHQPPQLTNRKQNLAFGPCPPVITLVMARFASRRFPLLAMLKLGGSLLKDQS
jgi:hypothetical protein